jgi:hypothetical protein
LAILHASFRLAGTVGRSGSLGAAAILGWPLALLDLRGLAALLLRVSPAVLGGRARLTLVHLPGLRTVRRLLHLGGFAFHRRLAGLLPPALSRFRAHSGTIRLSLGSRLARSLAHLALASFAVLAALHARGRLLALLCFLRKGGRN